MLKPHWIGGVEDFWGWGVGYSQISPLIIFAILAVTDWIDIDIARVLTGSTGLPMDLFTLFFPAIVYSVRLRFWLIEKTLDR